MWMPALDDDPTGGTTQFRRPSRQQKVGPQWPEWIDGICRAAGFSEKVTRGTLECEPSYLRRALSTSKRGESHRNEPVGVGGTPLVDMPVVVGLDHDLVHGQIRAFVQDLPGEARPIGKFRPARVPPADMSRTRSWTS